MVDSTNPVRHKISHRLATAYQLVTATGDLLEVTEKSHPDIFHALPMSYGTLGFVVGVTLKVVPYRPYIRIEYFPTRSLEETTNLLKQLTRYCLLQGSFLNLTSIAPISYFVVSQYDLGSLLMMSMNND